MYDNDNNKQIYKGKAKTGYVTFTNEGWGTATLTVKFHGNIAQKSFHFLKPASTESGDSSSASNDSSVTYGLNQKASVLDANKNPLYSLTVTSATKKFDAHGQGLVGNDIDFISISNEKSVQITVNYSNDGDSSTYLPQLQDFTAYDASGQAGDIVSQQEGQNEVSQGHSGTTTFWVNFANATPAGSKIELDYTADGVADPLKFDLAVN